MTEPVNLIDHPRRHAAFTGDSGCIFILMMTSKHPTPRLQIHRQNDADERPRPTSNATRKASSQKFALCGNFYDPGNAFRLNRELRRFARA
jgi:hypothetical protein